MAVARNWRQPFQNAVHAEDVAAIEPDGYFGISATQKNLRAECATHDISELGCDGWAGFGMERVDEDCCLGVEMFTLGL